MQRVCFLRNTNRTPRNLVRLFVTVGRKNSLYGLSFFEFGLEKKTCKKKKKKKEK